MNASELLRAGGWRQGHGESGMPYWEHAERYGLARWSVDAALGDELARVSRERDRLDEQLRLVRAELEPMAIRAGEADQLRALREVPWLVKDFNALYRAALAVFDAAEGQLQRKGEAARRSLGAQLERLKPAFAETEAAREKAGGA